jgi:hypothetical protein
MGDRANVYVKQAGVYLYTHWGGTELPQQLQKALAKRWRWNDESYLTRVIFDTMSEGEQGKETGFGIASWVGDGDDRVLTVDTDKQTVSISTSGTVYTFDEYIKGTPDW